MAFSISLLTVRSSGSMTPAIQAMLESYLLRCRPAFSAGWKNHRTEAQLLTAVAGERKGGAAALWIADPGGRAMTSEAFAAEVQQVRDNGLRHLMLAVGPADGWTASARSAAALRLSLGSMTLPHELAALLLSEQIYRAGTILQGHPYHTGH